LSDDYPTKGGEDLYSSIASDVGLEVDEESYKVLTGQARPAPAHNEEHKENDDVSWMENFNPLTPMIEFQTIPSRRRYKTIWSDYK